MKKGEKKLVSVDYKAVFHVRKNERKGAGGDKKKKNEEAPGWQKEHTMYWGSEYSQAAPVAQKPAEGTWNTLHMYLDSFVSLPFLSIAVTAVTQQLQWMFGLHSTFLT